MSTAKPHTLGVPHGQLFRGERIGKYEILTQLSVGGMAELFLAYTQGPGGFRKFVVIKRILPDARSNESFVRMFLDEARITASLSHPNIGQVFELGGEEDGATLYLAMEFIAGQNLNQITSTLLSSKRRLPTGFCVAVVRDVLMALHYAHNFTDSRGRPSPVIHRDVAQKNVMVTYDGQVKLLDFGIAKAQGSLGKTSVGMVKGTTGYMSPEQVRGEALDGRSDVFAAGILLFEILTGKRLFSAQTEAEEMERILNSPIPDATAVDPSIPGKLAAVVSKALARDRTLRYSSAKVMAKALDQAAGPLLFDQDQLAAFMEENFQSKMAATRALLDSAGQSEVTQVRQAASLLRRDLGSVFPGEQVADAPVPPPRAPPGVDLSMAAAKTEVADPLFVPVSTTQVEEDHPFWKQRRAGRVFGAVAGLVVLGSIGLWLGGKAGSSRKPAVTPMETPARPRQAIDPRKQGTLTLITQPESTVSAGTTALGRTPLIEAALPMGTQLLSVVGPDGNRRILTVVIRPGENTAVRVELESLPKSSMLRVE